MRVPKGSSGFSALRPLVGRAPTIEGGVHVTNADEGGFGGQATEGEPLRQEAPDPRGQMHRKNRLMPDANTREFLRAQNVAHVGTVDAKGWPYVVPLIYT
jgi:hypothetical protein